MANPYKEYGTDKNLEKNGFLYIHTPKTDEWSAECYVLARAGGSNSKFLKAVEVLSRPHRKRGVEKLSYEQQRSIMVQAFVEGVIIDWEGVRDKDDNEIPFSKDNVLKFFNDLPDMFDVIQTEAMELSNYLMEEVESDVKN